MRGGSRLLEELGSNKVRRCNDRCIPKGATSARSVFSLWIIFATTWFPILIKCDYARVFLPQRGVSHRQHEESPQQPEPNPREQAKSLQEVVEEVPEAEAEEAGVLVVEEEEEEVLRRLVVPGASISTRTQAGPTTTTQRPSSRCGRSRQRCQRFQKVVEEEEEEEEEELRLRLRLYSAWLYWPWFSLVWSISWTISAFPWAHTLQHVVIGSWAALCVKTTPASATLQVVELDLTLYVWP
jgi:hypothetical protein